jgi:hypothetical protein
MAKTNSAVSAKKKQTNPILEEKNEILKAFIESWMLFFQMVSAAYQERDKMITVEDEKKFLKIKSHCARKHEYLLEALGSDYINGERITSLLNATVTLRNIQTFHEEFYRKVERQWHTSLLNLHLAWGQLRYKIENS